MSVPFPPPPSAPSNSTTASPATPPAPAFAHAGASGDAAAHELSASTRESMMPHQPSPLLLHLHARFREVLGAPSSMLELDSQWSIRCRPGAPAIFVLVNGSYEKPAVWVFDPYTAENVWRTSITSTQEVDGAIEEIQRRASHAAVYWEAKR